MRKLWSAATIKLYGGGISEVEFLQELSQRVGEFERPTTSVSHGGNGRSSTFATRRQRIRGRGRAPEGTRDRAGRRGAPPALVRTAMDDRPRAPQMRAWLRENIPSAASTLAPGEASPEDVRSADPAEPAVSERGPM